MTKIKIEINLRLNHNPDNGPIGETGYTACECWPLQSGWLGAPLGRAATKEEAIQDLLNRANRESGTRYTVNDVEVVRDRSDDTRRILLEAEARRLFSLSTTEHVRAAHVFLCHPDGGECDCGANPKPADPNRVRIYDRIADDIEAEARGDVEL